MNDVMERLAAANPVRDGEPLSPAEHREMDELLARVVAEPAEATRTRGRAPRIAIAATGLACAALAAFVALDLAGSDGPSTAGVVDKAVAATTRPNTIYHVLERVWTPRGSDGRLGPFYMESWHTTDGRLHQKVFTPRGSRPGRLVQEIAGRRRPGRDGGPALMYSPRQNTIVFIGFGVRVRRGSPILDPFAGPGAQLRQLRHDGLLRASGTTEIGGKRAFRLTSQSAKGPGHTRQRYEYLVDPKTYLPLRLIQTIRLDTGRRTKVVHRYLTYDRRPLNSRTRGQLALDHHPGARCRVGGPQLFNERELGFESPCAP